MHELIKDLQQPGQGEAGFLPLSRAVFWSFFGVRKGKDLNNDAVKISPMQVIIAGFIGCAVLVLGFVALVRFIVG